MYLYTYENLSQISKTEKAKEYIAKIKEIVEVINGITNPETADKDFERVYKEISEKDWLYFNNEIRFEFIKRMADVSEFTFNYTVKFNGKKINPFGISVKTLSKEPIVYLKSEDDLFISASLDKFLNTRYIKNTKTLELKGLKSADALKRVKMEFASHFFDYNGTIKYNNLFHATKLHDGVKIPKEIIENNSSPVLTFIKKSELEKLLTTERNEPWYGQLMTTPQTIAYFVQINYWLQKYNIKIK